MQKEGVRRDVERDAEEHVARSLMHEQGKFPVCDKELEEHVAGRECHLVELARVPGGDDEPAAVRVLLNHLDHVRDLVHGSTVRLLPLPPLHPVHAAEVAGEGGLRLPVVGFSVCGPDSLLGPVQLLEAVVIPRSFKDPQEFTFDGLERKLLGREGREAVAHTEAHLEAEECSGARASSIVPVDTVLHDVPEGVEVGLFHKLSIQG